MSAERRYDVKGVPFLRLVAAIRAADRAEILSVDDVARAARALDASRVRAALPSGCGAAR